MKKHLHTLELTWQKMRYDLKAENYRGLIGYGWWIIEPLTYVISLYVIFGMGLRRGPDNFILFNFTGTVFWKWYTSSVQIACTVIGRHKALISQVYIPKYILVLSFLASNTLKFLVVFTILLVVAWSTGHPPNVHYIHLPLVLLVSGLLIASLSFLLASIGPFLTDLPMLITNLNMVLFFLSGIFFDVHTISAPVFNIIRFNPFLIMITSYRDVILYDRNPAFAQLLMVSLFASVLLTVAVLLMRHFDRVYPKIVH